MSARGFIHTATPLIRAGVLSLSDVSPAYTKPVSRQSYILSRSHCSFFTTRNYITSSLRSHPRSSISFSSSRIRYQSTSAPATPSSETPIQNNLKAPSSPRQPSKLRRRLATSALFFAFLFATFAMSAAPAADSINGFANPPTDAETLTMFEPDSVKQAGINDYIIGHPLAVKLRAKEGIRESRPHLKIPVAMRAHNLTAGTLMGHEKVEVPPLAFSDETSGLPSLTTIFYVGPQLCGHPGIVHGGFLATMLDEGLARTCFPALPNKVGVTASLKIDYRSPCPANSYLVLKAHTTKVEGRKAWVQGWIEILGETDGEGKRVVEAEALFIEPKGAASMARVYSSQ